MTNFEGLIMPEAEAEVTAEVTRSLILLTDSSIEE